ncbi:MAG: UvrD-helicase domain-containing protein [Bacteroidota bacterium]
MPLTEQLLTRPLKIYSSSAGSGKTYTLTLQYLLLVLRHPENYRHILAITFTKKATEEMKRRILKDLYSLSKNPGAKYKTELENAGFSPEQIQKNAAKTLSLVLHDYTSFSVSTIDSFFQKVIRAFAQEINLGNFRLELDQNAVLDDLIDMLLSDVGKNRQLTKWLTRFAESKVEEGKNWDFQKDIRELAGEIFKDNFADFQSSVMAGQTNENPFYNYRDALYALKSEFEEKMLDIGMRSKAVLKRHGADISHFSFGKLGFMSYLLRLASPNLLPEKYEPSKRATDVNDGNAPAYKYEAKYPAKSAIPEAAWFGGIQEALAEAIDLYMTDFRLYLSASEVLRYIYTAGILSDLALKLAEYRDKNNLFLMSDASAFLQKIIDNNDAPYIYEKTGNKYRHFFVDEFQDTSSVQWENIKPLMTNSIASENTNLIVGDLKQSIYRWRGGDWRLLHEKVKADVGPFNVEQLSLQSNFRSYSNVIDFNNSIFRRSPALLHLELTSKYDNDRMRNLADKLVNAYDTAFQKMPESGKEGGFVQVSFLDPKAGPDVPDYAYSENQDNNADAEESPNLPWKEMAMAALPRQIEQLQDSGYMLSDIAILVRTATEGAKVAKTIMDYSHTADKSRYAYDIISSDSLSICNARPVRVIVNALRYQRNTSDSVALVDLIQEYNIYIKKTGKFHWEELPKILERRRKFNKNPFAVQLTDSADEQKEEDLLATLLPEEFIRKERRAYLNKLPVYELAEALVRIFGLNELADDVIFLQAFLDLVLEYTHKEQGDLAGFLDWWDSKGCTKKVQIPAGQNAIQILTIHKSKGLEFKAVIIPFCSWLINVDAKKANVLWAQTNTEPFNILSRVPVKYSGRLVKTIFSAEHASETAQAYMDNLNLLYVATTRAVEALIISAPLPKVNKAGLLPLNTVGDVLYNLCCAPLTEAAKAENLCALHEYWDDNRNTLTISNIKPAFVAPGSSLIPKTTHTESETDELDRSSPFVPDIFRSERWRNRLSIRPQSKGFFNRKIAEAEEDEETDRIDIREQRINRGLLIHEVLANLSETNTIEKLLEKARLDGQVTALQQAELLAETKQLFENPQIAAWFGPGWEVKTESQVMLPKGEMLRPDRVLLRDNRAVVIDFKTGSRNNKHSLQVKRYMDLMLQMGYTKPEGWLVYLSDGAVVEVA